MRFGSFSLHLISKKHHCKYILKVSKNKCLVYFLYWDIHRVCINSHALLC